MTDIKITAIKRIEVEIPKDVTVWANVHFSYKEGEHNKLVIEMKAIDDSERHVRDLITCTIANLRNALIND